MLFTKDSYSFYKLGSAVNKKKEKINVWLPIEDDRILTKRILPAGLEYELYLEGTQVSFAASKLKDVTPHVFILSDGSVSPFELKLTDNTDHTYKMVMAENGKYKIDAVN